MRILLLTSSLPPRNVGGAETQAAATAVRLAARGHRVAVVARAVEGDLPGTREADGVTWTRLPVAGPPGLRILDNLRRYRRHVAPDAGELDVVLAYQTFANGLLAAHTPGSPPFAVWVRSEAEIRLRASRKYRLVTPHVVERAGRVLVQSAALAELLAREMTGVRGAGRSEAVRARTRILANAVDVEPPGEPGAGSGLVYVGRLLPVKGVDVLLEALRGWEDPPPLRIFGEGPEEARLRQLARGLPVTFEGYGTRADLRAALTAGAVLAAPSRSEGFPNVVLEAMERGTPAVSTPVGSIPEVVRDGETGFLVPPDDPVALRRRLQVLVEDEALRRRLGEAARRRAEGYAWEPHLERLETLLGETVETGGNR